MLSNQFWTCSVLQCTELTLNHLGCGNNYSSGGTRWHHDILGTLFDTQPQINEAENAYLRVHVRHVVL